VNRPFQSSLFEWLNRRPAGQGVLDTSAVSGLEIERAQIRNLHLDLEKALGCVDLIMTDNRRRMVSIKPNRGRSEVRLHHMFVGCDDHIVQAISGLARNDAHSRHVIREFIRQNTDVIRDRGDTKLEHQGEHVDLGEVLQEIRPLVPESPETVRITWGRDGKGRRSIRLGSYEFEHQLIRIHPALDAEWVPDFFVEFVVYHELLHAVFPPMPNARRRALHPPEFRAREEEFPRFREAITWEKANIHKLLSR